MKNFIVTQSTFALGCCNPAHEPENTLPSLTVPGMTLSLRDLVQRYTRGESVPTFTPQFHGDDELISQDLERMDVQDKLMLSKQLGNAIQTERSRRSSTSRPVDDLPSVSATPDPEAAIM